MVVLPWSSPIQLQKVQLSFFLLLLFSATVVEPHDHEEEREEDQCQGTLFNADDDCSAKNCPSVCYYFNSEEKTFYIELQGDITSKRYVAVGFSDDQSMGDDLVAYCGKSDDDKPLVKFGINEDKSGPKIEVEGKALNPMFKTEDHGKAECSFNMPANMNSVDGQRKFDLTKKDGYHVFIAAGPLDSQGSATYHDKKVSSDKVELTKAKKLKKSQQANILIQLHGSFMVMAWLLFGYVGVTFPEFFKGSWKGKQICKKDAWFILHRGMMYASVILASIGLVLIMVHGKGWHYNNEQLVRLYLHPVLGLTTIILGK